MKLTNFLGLPASIVNAIANDDYSKGDADLSVSQLISPARKVEIERQHTEELTEDASDRIWALVGQAVHEILRRADDDALTEQRLFIDWHDTTGKLWKISGAFDRLACTHAVLGDYKVTSVWAVKDGAKVEWEQQVNTYAYMLRLHGYWIDKLQVVAILRDWRKSESLKYPDSYPSHQVKVIDLPMWTDGMCRMFLDERIEEHRASRDKLPFCTPDERWSRPTVYAVVKNDNVKATKLCETPEAAQAYIDELIKSPKNAAANWKIDIRPGAFLRCEGYCAAAPYCSQWQDEQKGKLKLTTY
jgi:hypothetical protein